MIVEYQHTHESHILSFLTHPKVDLYLFVVNFVLYGNVSKKKLLRNRLHDFFVFQKFANYFFYDYLCSDLPNNVFSFKGDIEAYQYLHI